MRRQVSLLGVYYVCAGLVGFLLGGAVFMNAMGVGLVAVEGIAPALAEILEQLRPYHGVLTAILFVPSVICGLGLIKRRRFGLVLATIFAFMALIAIPVGTLFGIWQLWVLRRAKLFKIFDRDLFLSRYANESVEDHQIRVPDKPSSLLSAGLALLFLTLCFQLVGALILFGLFGAPTRTISAVKREARGVLNPGAAEEPGGAVTPSQPAGAAASDPAVPPAKELEGLYLYEDEDGVPHIVDSLDKVPPRYRPRAQPQ